MKILQGVAQAIADDRYYQPRENNWAEMCERLARECAKNEQDSVHWEKEFLDMLGDQLFVPAGRILRNLGNIKPSTSNCNVLPIGDSIEEIADCLRDYIVISKYGGGTGINFSPLRPKDAPLKTMKGESSGMISFLELFNHAGWRIKTGGQRRSAGIALCHVAHPEIFNFINAKTQEGNLDQFNISVVVTKEFLMAVEANATWDLKFAGKVYDTVKARRIWDMILENMLEKAEPGLINWDNLIKNNSYYFSPVTGVNPCGELPLEAYGVCNLGSLPLANYIPNERLNQTKFAKNIHTAVRFLDNIIDLAYYPISQQEPVVKAARRIGLGTMGVADYLFAKKLRYGSEEALTEIDRVYKLLRDEAYGASIELAKEKGAFPAYNKLDYTSASFIRKLPAKIRMEIKEHSIRNCTLLAAAPTGTTSLLAGVNGGIEPLPYKGYWRTDGLGRTAYIHPHCAENYDADWFVDAYDLTPYDHLETQHTIQKYIDGGVSKTIILPNKTSKNKLSKLLLEYIFDLKGCTVYRDGSREKEVYTRMDREEVFDNLNKEHTTESEVDDCSTGACDI